MKSVLLVNKPSGLTPLQYIEHVRENYPELAKEKISPAGRLDPMAEGLLLLLIAEENKKRSEYENLDKEYIFSVVFGMNTDSYDGLGIVEKINPGIIKDLGKILSNILPFYQGVYAQTFPPFSSKPYKGKPLYYWSRKQKINKEDLPKKNVSLFSLDKLSLGEISLTEIADVTIKKIKTIRGEFRQDEIILQWEELKKELQEKKFPIATFSLSCSSGTYVRSIAHELGEKVGSGAFAYSIKRTRIGTFTFDNIQPAMD